MWFRKELDSSDALPDTHKGQEGFGVGASRWKAWGGLQVELSSAFLFTPSTTPAPSKLNASRLSAFLYGCEKLLSFLPTLVTHFWRHEGFARTT